MEYVFSDNVIEHITLEQGRAMFAEVMLPVALVLIMGSLGLTLTPADFKRVLTAPKGVGIGLANLL